MNGDWVIDLGLWVTGLFTLACVVVLGLFASGVIPTAPPDPCVRHRAKLSDIHYEGWHQYGERWVWCGPGERP